MVLYFAALGIVWCVVWLAAALVLGGVPDWLRAHSREKWHRWSVAGVVARIAAHERIILAVAAIWFAGIYVLGYAPTMKAIRAGKLTRAEPIIDFYVPVQWLTDESALREPLLNWANDWGLRDQFASESDSRRRAHYWGNVPPAIYACGWSGVGLAFVFGPAWIIRYVVLRRLWGKLPARPGVV